MIQMAFPIPQLSIRHTPHFNLENAHPVSLKKKDIEEIKKTENSSQHRLCSYFTTSRRLLLEALFYFRDFGYCKQARGTEVGKQGIGFFPRQQLAPKWQRTRAKRVSRRTVYRLAKQHMMPERPRNQQQPMKRTSESPAVAQRRAWKKCAVRVVESDCDDRDQSRM